MRLTDLTDKHALIDLIYALDQFSEAELVSRYERLPAKPHLSAEAIKDYVSQLADLNILKITAGKYSMRARHAHEIAGPVH